MNAETHARFLPGIVSKLTNILTPQTKMRRSAQVLSHCLNVYQTLLVSTMSDDLVQDLAIANKYTTKAEKSSVEWQKTAAAQIKPALANVLRLKTHSRPDVIRSLSTLCLSILRQCRRTLAGCTSMILEALVYICSSTSNHGLHDGFESLVRGDSESSSVLQALLYDWLDNFPIVLQSNDEERKDKRTKSICTAYQILDAADQDLNAMNRKLALAIRDSVASSVAHEASHQSNPALEPKLHILSETSGAQSSHRIGRLPGNNHQRLEGLISLLGTGTTADLTHELGRSLDRSGSTTGVANFWLLVSLAENIERRRKSDLVQDAMVSATTSRTVVDVVYAHSLSILDDALDEHKHPQEKVLALKGLCVAARNAGREFRYELVDALYPVLHTLATPDYDLQRDSIATLDTFTSACGYSSTQDLIVDNVDYLTNCVALKLNAFDVSPQAPQVLLMMVQLAGPSLLPYLEDTVESIFAALEDFHGYPLLVEFLFKVLGSMVDQGAKHPELAASRQRITDSTLGSPEIWSPTSITGLTKLLELRRLDQDFLPQSDEHKEPHPRVPWSAIADPLNQSLRTEDLREQDSDDQAVDTNEPDPPAVKTYQLLHKVTELTQHFLPSASPSLRMSLLSLIKTAVPAIARHENSFLPLINTLWPEIVSRMDDEQPYVVSSAVELVGTLCEWAGDFMRSRIIQLWPRIVAFQHFDPVSTTITADILTDWSGSAVQRTGQGVLDVGRITDSPGLNARSSESMIKEALIGTITKIVEHVQLPPEFVDDAFDLLRGHLGAPEVHRGLQNANCDALWLLECKCNSSSHEGMRPCPTHPLWQYAETIPNDG